jgi:hypothetical protein
MLKANLLSKMSFHRWQLEGARLKVIRELFIKRDRGCYVPQNERGFMAVR